MRRFVSYGPAFVVLLTVVAVLLAGPAAVRKINSANTAARIVLAQRSLDDGDDILERLNRAVRNVADSVRPSVVHIEVIPEGGRRFVRSTGTGWVYDDAGHIVTNKHVVSGAARIDITFSDGRIVRAEQIKGQTFVGDPYTDIAVIKVAASDDVFPIRRATGLQPQQGDRVFVFGSPFGFKFSMSEGIISGLGRDPQTAAVTNGFTNFIQTDAAVNPGNSGGPLVDIKGRVIGMNVAIATGRDSAGTISDEGQSAGISFAIPLGTIESVVAQLIEKGEVDRGFMGVTLMPDATPVTDVPGFRGTGVGIRDVTSGGPADRAGLAVGDIVTEIDGQRAPTTEVLRSLISSTRPGVPVKLRVARDGKLTDLSIVLGDRPPEIAARFDREAAGNALFQYGLALRTTDDGVRVMRVRTDSAAETAGFAADQVILSVAGKPVRSTFELFNAVAENGLLLGRRIPFETTTVGAESAAAPSTIEVQILR